MNTIRVVDKFGVEQDFPRSIWDQLPKDKSGLKPVAPEEVKEVVEEVKPVAPEGGVGYPTDSAPSKEWTVDQLKEFASDNDISLGRARLEDAILKKIREAGF